VIISQTRNDGRINNEFVYVYGLKCDLPIENFNIQEEELDDLKWFDIDFILTDMYEHPERYPRHQKYWDEILNIVKELK
jgi:8-oxo-dGTP pyrophosphatase MutT (NUDIX family)